MLSRSRGLLPPFGILLRYDPESNMATVYLTTGADLPISERPKLHSCVSIVVDDVDGDDTNSCNEPQDGDEVFDDNASDVSHGSKSSRGSISREESESRLQQIKDEVQHRRDEFARLLDEHEQVVNELRRIESNSELRNLAESESDDQIFPEATESEPTSEDPSLEPSQSCSSQEE